MTEGTADGERIERVARAMFDAWRDVPEGRYAMSDRGPGSLADYAWSRSLSEGDRARWRRMAEAAIRAAEAGSPGG